MRFKILMVMIFILLATAVLAVKPTTQITPTSGFLNIKYPQQPFYIAQPEMEFHFHVFNSTGYLLTNASTSCFIHVYNASSSHVLKQDAVFDNEKDFEVTFGSNISNTVGYYSYIFECSNANEAGFVGDSFEITDFVNKDQFSGISLAIMILLPMILGLMLLIGSFVLDPEEHAVIRIFLMLLSFMTYFGSSWIGVQTVIRYYGFAEMQNSTTLMIFVVGSMIAVIIIYFLIYAFYKATHAAAQKKKEMMLQ